MLATATHEEATDIVDKGGMIADSADLLDVRAIVLLKVDLGRAESCNFL